MHRNTRDPPPRSINTNTSMAGARTTSLFSPVFHLLPAACTHSDTSVHICNCSALHNNTKYCRCTGVTLPPGCWAAPASPSEMLGLTIPSFVAQMFAACLLCLLWTSGAAATLRPDPVGPLGGIAQHKHTYVQNDIYTQCKRRRTGDGDQMVTSQC